jgi:ASC-1-like (ASCH) protein
MTNISINVQEPYRSFILQGKKIVESRLNKGKYATIQSGDILELEPEKITFVVVEKNIYKNFREMIEKEGIENIIPDKNNIDEAVDVYYKFYTKEQEDKFGVVAIKIKREEVA